MRNKLRVILIILLVFVLIQWNKKLMRNRIEITDLELVRVIGLDNETKNNAQITFVRNKLNPSKSSSNSNEESSDSSGSNVSSSSATQTKQDASLSITIGGKTFNEIFRKAQTYTEKEIPGGHIDYFLIGEKTATTDIIETTDFIAGDSELRYSGRVYIVKGSSAREFLSQTVGLDYKLADKLDNMEVESKEMSYVSKFAFTDLLKAITKEDKICLVPTIELISLDNDAEAKETEGEKSGGHGDSNTDKNNMNIDFDFSGYGILKDKKIVKFLTTKQSLACNIIMNKFNSTILNITKDADEIVALGIKSSNTNMKFEFDGDDLKKVIINNQFLSEFEEATPNMLDSIEFLEKSQSDIIKSNLEDIIQTSKDIGIDFLQISDCLKTKHPYKYGKIKDNWNEVWKNVDVEVIVESKIRRAYDVIH